MHISKRACRVESNWRMGRMETELLSSLLEQNVHILAIQLGLTFQGTKCLFKNNLMNMNKALSDCLDAIIVTVLQMNESC